MDWKKAGHGVFALGYVAMAGLSVVLLPSLRPETDPLLALVVGGQILLTGTFIHYAVWQATHIGHQSRRMQRMRRAYEELGELLLRNRQDVIALKRTLQGGTGATSGEDAAKTHPEPENLPLALAIQPEFSPAIESRKEAASPAGHPRGAEPAPAEDDHAIAAVIQSALLDNRFEVYLQPFVRLPKRHHRFFELLSRIRLPNGEILPPERFLPVAQREKLIAAIDRVMLDRALHYAEETDRRHHTVGFFCNLAAATVATPQALTQVLDRVAIQPGLRSHLIFELSQADYDAGGPALSQVAELGRQGFRFSMDSVQHLHLDPERLLTHHVHYVKIGAALLQVPEQRAKLLELINRFAGLPVTLVAEKIETEAQVTEITTLGIEYAGGFLFAPPRMGRRPA